MNVDKISKRKYRGRRVVYPELVVDQLKRFYETYSLKHNLRYILPTYYSQKKL